MSKRSRSRTRERRPARGLGFTLVELMIVMVIMGIIIAFILTAAMGGVRRAEERATQSLIAKLESGMTDRVDAILGTRVDANAAHDYLSRVYTGSAVVPQGVHSITRAQIIARFDQIKAELPDVFVVQNNADYPLNFAASPFNPADGAVASLAISGTYTAMLPHYQYLLPMGVGCQDSPAFLDPVPPAMTGPPNPSGTVSYGADIPLGSTGIYGASYSAAAGLYKSLAVAANGNGFAAPTPANAGYDGTDNNGNGLIDEMAENGALAGTFGSPAKGTMYELLSHHTHKTARAEVLYAILVEGQGPLGSVFSRDEFTDKEVRDTDGDGLPEFVDAWGEPIQYFRWPIFFQSDTQKGASAYVGTPPYGPTLETREQNPLDTNQSLVDPAWWSNSVTGSVFMANGSSPFAAATGPLSGSAYFFQSYFHSLTDPNASFATAMTSGVLWDRSTVSTPFVGRREFFSKFLVISGGPDKALGVPILDPECYSAVLPTVPTSPVIGPGGSGTFTLVDLRVESQAAQATPFRSADTIYFALPFVDIYPSPFTPTGVDTVSDAYRDAGNDDISNHTLSAPGGATQ